MAQSGDMAPRATVVLASFGSIGRDTLRSLDRQSLPVSDFEVVIVQDVADSRELRSMTQLADNRPNVRLHPARTSGHLGARRNAGASAATGDYVLFLDGGNVLGDQALERLCNYADEHTADICLGKTSHSDRQSGTATTFAANRPRAQKDATLLGALHAGKIYRRSFLEASRVWFADDSNRCIDIGFDLDAVSRTEAISVLADYPAFTGARARTIADATEHLVAVTTSSAPEELRQQALLGAHLRNLDLLNSTARNWLSVQSHPDLAAYRDALNTHVPRAFDEHLATTHRTLTGALRDGDLDDVGSTIDQHRTRLRVRNVSAVWVPGALELNFDVRLRAADPGAADLLQRLELGLCVYGSADGVEWTVPEADVDVAHDSGSGDLHVTGLVRPDSLAGGEPLPPGEWVPTVRVVDGGLARRMRLPFSKRSAGASYAAGRTTVSFDDAGKLALDVGAGSRPVVSRLNSDLASVSEDARGSRLRVELPNLDLPQEAELAGHLRIGRLPVPATIRVDNGRPVLQSWVSGLAGSYPLATKFSSAPYATTGLALEIDGVGGMTARPIKRKTMARTKGHSQHAETPVRAFSSTTNTRRMRRAIKRVPGAQKIYRRVRAAAGR